MDTSAIMIGIVTLLICVVPLILMRNSKKRKEKEVKEAIAAIAAKSNSKVEESHGWNNTLIGIDRLNSKLFFIKKLKDTKIEHTIDLSEIETCRVIHSQRNVVNGNYSVTQKLELGLISRNRGKAEIQLEFYNLDYDSLTMTEELHLAEKWADIINTTIAKHRALV
jgi:hypothetical protein